MDKKLRQAQIDFLKVFSKQAGSFALAGGTALELYYLHHRFSADLDFFSPQYNEGEIDGIVEALKHAISGQIKLETNLVLGGRAKLRFYSADIKELDRPLKIDFVEDVLFNNPKLKYFGGVPVYGSTDIYLQKIVAVTGTRFAEDDIGRQDIQGRKEARDIFDIYMLSKKTEPLSKFLTSLPRPIQRGMVRWYQTFSRQDLKLGVLDLEIYDKTFDAKKMIVYLEDQIRKFIKEEIEA